MSSGPLRPINCRIVDQIDITRMISGLQALSKQLCDNYRTAYTVHVGYKVHQQFKLKS